MDEISGTRALLRIAMALPMVERSYAVIRFLILRVKLLAVMDLLLPAKGRILDVGCGFGLWTAYFGQLAPGRQILGVDRSEKRVQADFAVLVGVVFCMVRAPLRMVWVRLYRGPGGKRQRDAMRRAGEQTGCTVE